MVRFNENNKNRLYIKYMLNRCNSQMLITTPETGSLERYNFNRKVAY
jgi:hypothetical protein